MIKLQKVKLVEQLPATPCTEDMRKRIVDIAKSENVSIAQVQRVAYEFFLSRFDGNAIKLDGNAS